MVLDRISEERDDASVSKKGILAVSAITRGHRPALDSMDKERHRVRLTRTLFSNVLGSIL